MPQGKFNNRGQQKISHKEDGKKIQGQQLSDRQISTTEYQTKISHIEDGKETAQGQYHLTGKVPQPKTK